jgi:hypothetical protein
MLYKEPPYQRILSSYLLSGQSWRSFPRRSYTR